MKCNKLMKEAIKTELGYASNIVEEWVQNSANIVKEYIDKGSHKEMDEFFKNTKPDYKFFTYRIGLISNENLNRLQKGSVVYNPIPFASSINHETASIFETIAKNRQAKELPDTRIVEYRIDNENVPQYKIKNNIEPEVIIKPNTNFYITDIGEYNDKIIIHLRSIKRRPKEAIPLLSASGLLYNIPDGQEVK